jgi:hypothetical protein
MYLNVISKYNIFYTRNQMRDILNLLDSVVLEGVGLANRKPGELFKNAQGDVIAFQNLTFYPETGAFPSKEEASAAVDQVAAGLKTTPQMIKWTNQQPAKGGGFGIATFINQADNKPYYLGRWFQTISPNRIQNNFPNNAIPGEFKYQSKLGVKENTGYKPSEVLTQFQNNTPATIQKQIVAKFGADSAEAQATAIFMAAKSFPITFPKGTINFTAFRDYFGEMLQPMALVLGKPVAGNAQEAADIFFGKGVGYSNSTISFNEGVAGGLYDSLLVDPSGKQIKLSSKGASGANASVVNLLNCVKELEATPRGQKLLKAHPDVIAILETINKGGHFGGPLNLAVQFGMISEDEKQAILDLKPYGPQDQIPWGSYKRLQKMYGERRANDMTKIIPIEHMTAIIAYQVADYINKNTDFSNAAADILNNSALVQMYTEATETADTISITGFRAVWPSTAVSGVELRADKSYYSTGGKGNLVFKILKGGAPVKEEVGSGSSTEEVPLEVKHGIIPSNEPQVDNIAVYGRKFKR